MPLADQTGKRVIDCREAARRYGCTRRYIRQLAQDAKPPYKMVGGCYVFRANEVDNLKLEAAKATGRKRKRAEGFNAG